VCKRRKEKRAQREEERAQIICIGGRERTASYNRRENRRERGQ